MRQLATIWTCPLTPELSRAERGGWEPVLPACRQVSTKPRHGVGLNDLLGGKEAGEGETLVHLPKDRSPDAWARPENFQLDLSEVTACGADKPNERKAESPKPINARHADCERALRTSTEWQRAEKLSEEHCQPKPMNCSCGQQSYKTLFTA